MARKFRFDWRLALLVGVLLPTMVWLGFWQLRRADENTALIKSAEQKRQRPPVSLSTMPLGEISKDIAMGNTDEWQLQSVSIDGQWLEKVFLLENQPHDGRNGYDVIGVMQLVDKEYVLVNRGWVAAPALRSELPAFPKAVSGIEFGEIYTAHHILQDEPLFAEAGWPRRIGRMNVPGVEHELGVDVLPLIVRLHNESPSALITGWPIVNILPEKNTAYAIQWFAMSVALLIVYLVFSFRTEIEDTKI